LRIAALVLGIIGGVFGLVGGLFFTALGGLGASVQADGASAVAGVGLLGILISIYAIIAGAVALKFPRFSGWSQLVAGIVGLIFLASYISGPILLIGGILALVSAKQGKGAAQNAA
jgi:hypothetical protein